MKTEIPKEDGYYWLRRKNYGIKMSRVFTGEHGDRMVLVHGMHSPTTITIYHHPYEIGECEFVRIEEPQ